jgi:hypothetical protein
MINSWLHVSFTIGKLKINKGKAMRFISCSILLSYGREEKRKADKLKKKYDLAV